MTKLTFLGAARTVTGSKYLLETGGRKILIDCGLFQGLKELRLRNWEPLPFDPVRPFGRCAHARAPRPHRLSAEARGRWLSRQVFCTPGTADLCKLVLPDSARLQEEDAREANRQHYSKHNPALPLYRESDAFRALSQLQPVGFDKPMSLDRRRRHRVHQRRPPAGIGVHQDDDHRHGPDRSCSAATSAATRGRCCPIRRRRPQADVLLLESTYGDRMHEPDDRGARLAAIIKDTVARGGKVIIPAFAIGRVEEVLYWIKNLEDAGRFRSCRCFSTARWRSTRCATTRTAPRSSTPTFRRRSKCAGSSPRGFSRCRRRSSRSELVRSRIPSIVVSSSGMATGGRVLHHLRGGAAGQAQHRAVRRLSGGGHARPAARGRRARGEDSRAARAGQRAHRTHRFDVGARRFAGNAAVARRLHARRRG